ncbi:MAG: phospholipid carrier-dependent glycosyltransferase [Proteobacteria bacterium]|nr:phospholipid carrier-dependent glycosyltransferase [Pseudomonadota bacterium]
MQKNSFYRLSLILLTLLQIGLSALYLNSLSRVENWSAVYAEDSRGYLLVADYLSGRDIPGGEQSLMRYRLFSPLVPFAASLLGNLTGIPAAFLIINILLWLITPLLFYEFLKTVLQDDFFAFAGAALFTTSLPVIEWGLPVMADMGSYFFACLIPFLYLRWFQPAPLPSRERVQGDFPSPRGRGLRGGGSIKNIFLGITLALALLTKPMLIILLLFVLFSLIYEKRYTSIPATCVLPIILVIAVYSVFSLTYNDFTTFGGPRHRGPVCSAVLLSRGLAFPAPGMEKRAGIPAPLYYIHNFIRGPIPCVRAQPPAFFSFVPRCHCPDRAGYPGILQTQAVYHARRRGTAGRIYSNIKYSYRIPSLYNALSEDTGLGRAAAIFLITDAFSYQPILYFAG